MTRDHMSAIRGRIAGLNQRAQNVNTLHATRGRDIAHTDHEAAYMPGTGTTGPRSSDTPDPTHNAATRPKPTAPYTLELDTLKALDTVAAFIHQLEQWAKVGNPNAHERPEGGAPCAHGWLHAPRPDGKLCDHCGRPWPCNPDKPESWVEPCLGRIHKPDTHCTPPGPPGKTKRVGHLADGWTCMACGDTRYRSAGDYRRNLLCEACDRAKRRHEQATRNAKKEQILDSPVPAC